MVGGDDLKPLWRITAVVFLSLAGCTAGRWVNEKGGIVLRVECAGGETSNPDFDIVLENKNDEAVFVPASSFISATETEVGITRVVSATRRAILHLGLVVPDPPGYATSTLEELEFGSGLGSDPFVAVEVAREEEARQARRVGSTSWNAETGQLTSGLTKLKWIALLPHGIWRHRLRGVVREWIRRGREKTKPSWIEIQVSFSNRHLARPLKAVADRYQPVQYWFGVLRCRFVHPIDEGRPAEVDSRPR